MQEQREAGREGPKHLPASLGKDEEPLALCEPRDTFPVSPGDSRDI